MTDTTDDDERAAIRGELLATLRVTAPKMAARLDDHWREEGTTVQMPVDPVPRTCSVCGEKIKARAETSLSLDLKRGRYEQEQRKLARKKALDKHSKLIADRELMEIKSPADGIVYYGQCVNGKWTDASSLEAKYQPHNNVAGGSVLMTIVDERPLTITAQLDEGKLPEVSKVSHSKM